MILASLRAQALTHTLRSEWRALHILYMDALLPLTPNALRLRRPYRC